MLILLRAAFGRGFQPESNMKPEPSGLDFWSPSRPMSTRIAPGMAAADYEESTLRLEEAALRLDQKRPSSYDGRQLQTVRPPPPGAPEEYGMEQQRRRDYDKPGHDEDEEQHQPEPGSPRPFHLPLRIDGRQDVVRSPRSAQDLHGQFDRRQRYDSDTSLYEAALGGRR